MVKRTLMGVCWGAVCASVSAMSLGSLQGQAVMGRPLQLSVPVALAVGESGDALCPRVRLRQGDEAMAGVRVSVRPDAMRSDRVLLLIESPALLTEPYVILDVTVGCGGQVHSRAYTVLVDLPVLEVRAGGQARGAAQLHQAEPGALGSGGAERPAGEKADEAPIEGGASVAHTEATSVAGAPVAQPEPTARGRSPQKQALSSPPKPQRVVQRAALAPRPAGPRLELDPLELQAAVEAVVPRLALSRAMGEPADLQGQDEALRQQRQTARAMWRALNESPEGVVQAQSLAQSLAQSQVQWQEELARAQAAQQAAQQRAVEAEEGVYTHPLVLALAALAALGLGGTVALWRRQAQADGVGVPRWTLPARGGQAAQAEPAASMPTGSAAPWWTRRPAWLSGKREAAPAKDLQSVRSRWAARWPQWLKWFTRTPQEDSLLSLFEAPAPLDTRAPTSRTGAAAPEQPAHTTAGVPSGFRYTHPPASRPPSDFLHSTLFDGGRSVAAEELLDLQQQVEFFISLGQAEQAVEVLQAHLADSSEPSPLAYLDLLKLHHELGRRQEYEALRAVFNREFHAHAPDFEHFQYSRRGLERYETALSRIVMLWPKPEVLDVIEQSIFRRDQSEPAQAFDLEAYRELLLLYAIARDRIAQERQEGAGSGGARAGGEQSRLGAETVIQPLSAQASPPFAHRAREAAAFGPGRMPSVREDADARDLLPAGGLDLDLSQLLQEASQVAQEGREPGEAANRGAEPSGGLRESGERAVELLAGEDAPAAASEELEHRVSAGGLDLELPDWQEMAEPGSSASGTATAPGGAGNAALWSLDLTPPEKLQIRKSGDERA